MIREDGKEGGLVRVGEEGDGGINNGNRGALRLK